MYSNYQLGKKYLHYLLTASNRKGHGVHSPFVFNFIKKVLNDKIRYSHYPLIEARRKALLLNDTVIDVEDFGAGSSVIKTNKRVIRDIAASSLKPKKYARLLYRMVRYYQPETVLELGTSFGITSAYLSSASEKAKLYTCEGAGSIASIAEDTFRQLGIQNIELVTGDFSVTIEPLLQKLKTVDLAFIDGNHRRQPTLDYFHLLLQHADHQSIFVFDDIHWSEEMESAWTTIKQHPAVTLTIDLFFVGIVCINPDFKIPQHFTIRF